MERHSYIVFLFLLCVSFHVSFCRNLRKRDVEGNQEALSTAVFTEAAGTEISITEQNQDAQSTSASGTEAELQPNSSPNSEPGSSSMPEPKAESSSVIELQPETETSSVSDTKILTSGPESQSEVSTVAESVSSGPETASGTPSAPDSIIGSGMQSDSPPTSEGEAISTPSPVPVGNPTESATEPEISTTPGYSTDVNPNTDDIRSIGPEAEPSVPSEPEQEPTVEQGTQSEMELSGSSIPDDQTSVLLPEPNDETVAPETLEVGPDPEPEPDKGPVAEPVAVPAAEPAAEPTFDGDAPMAPISPEQQPSGTNTDVISPITTPPKGFEDDGAFPFQGGFVFDSPLFSFQQIEDYFRQLEKAMEKIFRQTMKEVDTDPDVYKNTTERIVDVDGTKYKVHTTVIKGGDENSAVSIEAVSAIPADKRRKRSLF